MQTSTASPNQSASLPSATPSNHPLRPLSTLDSGMYTSSDEESDHEDSTNQRHSDSHPQSPTQRMKFTTFGKNQSIPEETLFEEG